MQTFNATYRDPKNGRIRRGMFRLEFDRLLKAPGMISAELLKETKEGWQPSGKFFVLPQQVLA